MPRTVTSLPLNLPAVPEGAELYRWLYEQLRTAILEGRLRPGAQLPASRDLAKAYGLSRTTIVTAYEQLRAEGYVSARHGSGTYVSKILPDDLLTVDRADVAGGVPREAKTPGPVGSKQTDRRSGEARESDGRREGGRHSDSWTRDRRGSFVDSTQDERGSFASGQEERESLGSAQDRRRSFGSAQEGRGRPSLHPPHQRISFSAYAKRLRPFRSAPELPVRAFRTNQSALDLFPMTLWAQVASSRLRRASTALLGGGEALGYRPLREAVAEYLNTSRGVKCTTEQVLIVSGAQEGFDRTARLLLDEGDLAWMEEPGYPGATAVLLAMGAKICFVPIDEEGMDFEAAVEASRTGKKGSIALSDGRISRSRNRANSGSGERYKASRNLRSNLSPSKPSNKSRLDEVARPKLVYVTPGHQFPLGVTMSLRRRLALLEWARKAGVMIFEDDYDSEYRYSGRPVPALQGLDRAGVVIFSGSFSAVMFPGLRLGYLVVPEEMVDIFAAAQSVSTHHPAMLGQAVLCDFIREGHFARHIRRMREIYADRLGVLLETAGRELRGMITISNVEAGLQTIGILNENFSAEKLVKGAAAREVELKSLSRYYSGETPKNGIVLGFAAVEPKELERGVREVALLLKMDESRYLKPPPGPYGTGGQR